MAFTFNPGQLPVGFDAGEAGNWFGEGEGVRLPFPAPLFSWMHGNAQLKRVDPALWCGGWSVDADKLEMLKVAPPEGYNLVTRTGARSGEDFDAFVGRYLGLAPIARRYRWEKRDDDGNEKGGRSNMQVLCLAAMWDSEANAYLSMGPVVVGARGLAGKGLTNVFKRWNDETAQARKQYAANLPANLFYAAVGTFGPEPLTEQLGNKQKFTGTMPQLRSFDDYTPEVLQSIYIGAQGVSDAIEYKAQAAEWLADWAKDKQGAAKAQAEVEGVQLPF